MSKFATPVIDIKKYGGRQVAIARGKIIADGRDTQAVLAKAKKRVSRATWRDILLVSVPKGLTVVYRIGYE